MSSLTRGPNAKGLVRVPTARGKQGKWQKDIPVRENTGNLEVFAKTQGIWFAQVVNSLILKVKDISIFTAKNLQFFFKLDKSVKSFLCM